MPLLEAEIGEYAPNHKELLEFENRLYKAKKEEESVPIVTIDGQPVEWFPQEGSQEAFLSADGIFEMLLHGPRGTGKTDVLLMSFARECEQGHGADWRGILFRETYPQLADVVAKTKKWFPRIFGNRVKFNQSAMRWEWKTGEFLLLRHMSHEDDYYKYHGHAYPWIGWEELTNWSMPTCYKRMMSCCRSDNVLVPRMVRATCNPYGPGHSWVKLRFRLPVSGVVILDSLDDEGKPEPARVAVQAFWEENKVLLRATPDYAQIIASAARNESEKLAWLEGSWDIVAGGILDEAWIKAKDYALVDEFEIPRSWRIYRAYDHGEAKPFSVGWYAVSDGTGHPEFIRGDTIRICEWYGWSGEPNVGCSMTGREIARGILEREMEWGIHGRVTPGPADGVYTRHNQQCIADDMEKPIKIAGDYYKGVGWEDATPLKTPGSRVAGADRMRMMLKNTIPSESGIREEAGFFLFRGRNTHWERTVPSLARDPKKLDDADSDGEDHVYDECRYMLQFEPNILIVRR